MQGDMVSREDLELELQEIEAHAPGQIEGVCASGGLQRATQAKMSARTAGSDGGSGPKIPQNRSAR